MSVILRRHPFLEKQQTVSFQGSEVNIKANQLAVWVSLSLDRKKPGRRPFPALIDTGFGYTFAIHADQLYDWARVHPNYHSQTMRLNGITYSRVPEVFLWLYRKWSISAHELAFDEPIRLETDGTGIAVNTRVIAHGIGATARLFPRLPLIGMKTLRQNRLRLFVDAWKSRFSLYKGRIWPWH